MKNRIEKYSLSDSVLTTLTNSHITITSNFLDHHHHHNNGNNSHNASARLTATDWEADRRAAKLNFTQFSQLFHHNHNNTWNERKTQTITADQNTEFLNLNYSKNSINGNHNLNDSTKSLFFNSYWNRRKTIGGDSSSHRSSLDCEQEHRQQLLHLQHAQFLQPGRTPNPNQQLKGSNSNSSFNGSDRSEFVIVDSDFEELEHHNNRRASCDNSHGASETDDSEIENSNTNLNLNLANIVCHCNCNYNYNNCECHCDSSSDELENKEKKDYLLTAKCCCDDSSSSWRNKNKDELESNKKEEVPVVSPVPVKSLNPILNPINNFCQSLWTRGKVKKQDNKLIQNLFCNYFKKSDDGDKKVEKVQKTDHDNEAKNNILIQCDKLKELTEVENINIKSKNDGRNNKEGVINYYFNCHCHCTKCACRHYNNLQNIDINGDSLELELNVNFRSKSNSNSNCNSNSNLSVDCDKDNNKSYRDVSVVESHDNDNRNKLSTNHGILLYQTSNQSDGHIISDQKLTSVSVVGEHELNQNLSSPLISNRLISNNNLNNQNYTININCSTTSNNSNKGSKQYYESRKNEAIFGRRRGRGVLRSMSENADADPDFHYSSSILVGDHHQESSVSLNKSRSNNNNRKEQLQFYNSYHSSTNNSELHSACNKSCSFLNNLEQSYQRDLQSQFVINSSLKDTTLNSLQKSTGENNVNNLIVEKVKPKLALHSKTGNSVTFGPTEQINKMEKHRNSTEKGSVELRQKKRNPSARSDTTDDEKHVFHSGDDETSSTYSTAEEDHDQPEESDADIERRALSTTSCSSAYATPEASLSASKHSLFTFGGSNHGIKEEDLNLTAPRSSDLDLSLARRRRGEESDWENDTTDDNNLKDKPLKRSMTEHENKDKSEYERRKKSYSSSAKVQSQNQSLSSPDSSSLTLQNSSSNSQNSMSNQSSLSRQPSSQFLSQGGRDLDSGVLLVENQPISASDLQNVFNCFKGSLSKGNCETLLDSLLAAQSREDFQWALHQLGGFNALLFLYARVVEICSEDLIQSKGLSLVLTQLRNHSRLTDGPTHRQYHLIRFILNSEKCSLGFKTFINIMNFSLSASGLKLVDYQLLDTCLLSCWKSLTRVRCTESDAPTGRKTLFECLLTIILDLLEERNSHREVNVALLKANRFSETLLSICYHIIVDHDESLKSRSPSPHSNGQANSSSSLKPGHQSESQPLNLMDGLRLASLVKAILAELMAPPDAYVAVTLVKYGLCPLLPKELPPLPRREDAYFIHQKNTLSPTALLNLNNLNHVREAEEAQENQRQNQNQSQTLQTNNTDTTKNLPGQKGAKSDQAKDNDHSLDSKSEFPSKEEEEDVPEILGMYNMNNNMGSLTPSTNTNINANPHSRSSSPNTTHMAHEREEELGAGEFSSAFQESLLEGVMSILLSVLSILPDAAFHSVLSPHLSSYLFIAYSSHNSVPLKKLSLKLLSAHLTRVKPPVLLEFLKSKGFYLASLYIQGNPEVAPLIVNICHGFGPLSYPLAISLLYSNTVVNSVLEWILSGEEEERKGPAITIPALMSMGLFNSIFNIHNSSLSGSLQKPLQNLLSIATRFCVLTAKEEPWKNALVPAIESAYGYSSLVPKIVIEATEFLRKNKGDPNFIQNLSSYHHHHHTPGNNINNNNNNTVHKGKKMEVLKKSDSNTRLLWLLERSACGSKMGTQFDRWLLNIFTLHMFEMEEDEETEYWLYFVKKNRKKLNQLFGIFLCRIFSSNKENLEFKHHVIRVLLTFCPNLNSWLPKVIRYDEQIERTLTCFVRIFLSTAENQGASQHRKLVKTMPSFHSLVSDQGGNLTLTLNTEQTIRPEVTNSKNPMATGSVESELSRSVTEEEHEHDHDHDHEHDESVIDYFEPSRGGEEDEEDEVAKGPGHGHRRGSKSSHVSGRLSDKSLRSKFEAILVDLGILSPTSSFSTFSADFRNFKILLETNSSASSSAMGGVSPIELRQCITSLDKMRAPYTLGMGNHHHHSHHSSHNSSIDGGSKYIVDGHGNYFTHSSNYSHPQGKPGPWNCGYFDGVFEAVNKYAMEMLISVARTRTQQEVEVARRICVQDADIDAIKQWINVMEQMVHPKAPWYFPDSYPSFCALDQSEGPGRVRARLKREHLRVHNRFVMSKYRKSVTQPEPLEYLFLSHSAELLKIPLIINEIQYMRFCTRIIPGEELSGEIILTSDNLTFIAEHAHVQSENVEVRKTAIKYLMKRRYTLEDRAVEIFLECRSFLFVFKTKKDREEFVSLLGLKHVSSTGGAQSSGSTTHIHSVNSTLMETSMTNMTSQWLKGQLSNFEYLMYLNTAAGRTYCDLMQYPVFPFVLSKYDSPTLDLTNPQSYRDLKKPMAIQDSSKEEHFISTYNYLKRECDSAPFHYGSHYSNSGIVLHFLVRLPPYTQHFLSYQDGSFDIPDRSFHSMETTWRLASKESNTDFKEAIPEFFYLPEFLRNLQHFDLGVRQSGQRVDDVVLPPWSKGDARLFTLINRQALESNHVRKFLCDWIDLIFGYKQGGKAALQALNVFHPSTYEGFEVDGNGDELLIRARKAMVSTYGQTPKQLFAYPHPRPAVLSEEKCELEVLDTVWGIRWGNFLGSPACPDLEVIHTREYQEPIRLFETNSRVVFWPNQTIILGDNVVGYWDEKSIRVKQTVVFNSIGDDITVCVGTSSSSLWVGHVSGRISVLKMCPKLDKVLEKVELIGHYKPIRKIHVNQDFSTAISCSGENYAIQWDVNKYPKIAFNNAIECSEAIDDIHSSSSTGDVVLLNKQYNRVTLATINGFIVGAIELDERVHAVCLSALDPGRNVNVIAVGCDNGIIRFYSSWDLKFLNQIKVLPLASLPIQSVRYNKDGRRFYCLATTEEGAVTVVLQLEKRR